MDRREIEAPDRYAALRRRYVEFAAREAHGVSPLYEEMALAMSESDPTLELLLPLPSEKQQPNLVFASARLVCGLPASGDDFVRVLRANWPAVEATLVRRRTQTNEPGRCATLLPALSRLPEPLAILEVGAAAGLCLLPDEYGYDYGRVRIEAPSPGAPVFPCEASANTPLPDRCPAIVWRAGVDLNPLDPTDPEAARWLEMLVWPGQAGRAQRLRAAIEIARRNRATVVRGDLTTHLEDLAARAPEDATLVIFHSAVLAYLDAPAKQRFVETVARLGARWICNEAPGVLPAIAAKLSGEPPVPGFLLALDGEPLAVTGAHGQFIRWLETRPGESR